MEQTMNVLELVRKKVQKKLALEGTQKASLKAQPGSLVYRGVPYRNAK